MTTRAHANAEKLCTFKRGSVVTKSVPSFGRCVKVAGASQRGEDDTRGDLTEDD